MRLTLHNHKDIEEWIHDNTEFREVYYNFYHEGQRTDDITVLSFATRVSELYNKEMVIVIFIVPIDYDYRLIRFVCTDNLDDILKLMLEVNRMKPFNDPEQIFKHINTDPLLAFAHQHKHMEHLPMFLSLIPKPVN